MNKLVILGILSFSLSFSIVDTAFADQELPYVCTAHADPGTGYAFFIDESSDQPSVTVKFTQRGRVDEEATYFFFGKDALPARFTRFSTPEGKVSFINIEFSIAGVDGMHPSVITFDTVNMDQSDLLLFGQKDKTHCMTKAEYETSKTYE